MFINKYKYYRYFNFSFKAMCVSKFLQLKNYT